MSQTTRVTTFLTGQVIDPVVHNQEHDNFVASINDNHARITTIESGTLTITGSKTVAGTWSFTSNPKIQQIDELNPDVGVTIDGLLAKDGAIRFKNDAAFTPSVNGDLGYDNVDNSIKAYINSVVRHLLHTSAVQSFDMNLSTPKDRQVLTYDSASSKWVNDTGVGWELIAVGEASDVGQFVFNTGIDSVFDQHVVIFDNVNPVTNDTYLRMQFSDDAGINWIAGTNYFHGHVAVTTTNAVSAGINGDDETILCSNNAANTAMSNSADSRCSGVIWFHGLASTTYEKQGFFDVNYKAANGLQYRIVGNFSCRVPASAFNAIRFLPESGNFASGNFRLYGVKKTNDPA